MNTVTIQCPNCEAEVSTVPIITSIVVTSDFEITDAGGTPVSRAVDTEVTFAPIKIRHTCPGVVA
jgi:hypothetical protein